MRHTESIGISRRRLLAMAGVSAGAAMFTQSPLLADPNAQFGEVNSTARDGTNSFSSLKQIDAGLLNVGYAEAGPVGGKPVPSVESRSFFFTVGPTTFTASSTSRLC